MNIIKKLASFVCITATALSLMAGCSMGSLTGSENSEGNKDNTQTMISDYTISLDSISDVLGAGWNYGNTLEASSEGHPNETIWGNPQASQLLVDAVADAGFSTIRIPVSYLDYIDDENKYKVDEAWLDRIQEVVDYCYNRNLNVIINVHGDGYKTVTGGWLLVDGENQDEINEKFGALWTQISKRFSAYDEHLIFESMNEVFNGEYSDPDPTQYENLNRFNQTFVDSVRATGLNNTHRWLLVPGWNTNIDYTVGNYGFTMPTDESNTAGENRLMLSVHYYDPWDYCGQEDKKNYLWGKKGDEVISLYNENESSKASWGEESHAEEQFAKLKENFVDKGIPVVIGEYGCIDKALANEAIPNQIAENRVYYDGFIAGTAAKMGITPIYWDNGYNGQYGFGLFIRAEGEQSQPEIVETIISAFNMKNPEYGMYKEVSSYISSAPSTENIPDEYEFGEEPTESYINNGDSHAFIGLQTELYTFRNAYDEAIYGSSSEWFDKVAKWVDENGDNVKEMADTGAVIEDAVISGNGTYTVSVSGYNFYSDSSAFNSLFISTDFDYSDSITVSDVVITMDSRKMNIENPLVYADTSGHTYIELLNKFNADAPKFKYMMPTEKLEISFRIEGV